MRNVAEHLRIDRRDLGETILLPGDPARAAHIARRYLEKPRELAKNREFWSYL